MKTIDKSTLSILWARIDEHIRACPPRYEEYRNQGMAWAERLANACETAIPQGCPETAAQRLQRLERALREHFTVCYVPPVCKGCGKIHNEDAKGSYLPKQATIYVQPDDPRRMFSTMVHEAAHALICACPSVDDLSHEQQELLAETTSCLVLARHGLDNIEQAAAYLAPYVVFGDLEIRSSGPIVTLMADKIEQLIAA